MEVKIGIQNVGREIVLESSLDAEAVGKLVSDALSKARNCASPMIRAVRSLFRAVPWATWRSARRKFVAWASAHSDPERPQR